MILPVCPSLLSAAREWKVIPFSFCKKIKLILNGQEYIFESNGVKYFKDIPLRYQIALVKNLNKLIKFKSTDKCIVDIISLFGFRNINAFKYYKGTFELIFVDDGSKDGTLSEIKKQTQRGW